MPGPGLPHTARLLAVPIWAAAANLLLWLNGRQPATGITGVVLGGITAWLWLTYRRSNRDTPAYRRMAASLATFALLTITGVWRGPDLWGWLLVEIGALAFALFVWMGEEALRVGPG